ncbi:serine carboxypeptidase [Artemisia annua]|uniref:Serine carboxypeptidase n=1 Tax=Artemisia annua TaxID=35608 RepID=A0A2U1NFP5_ARTAN|nr:serine carboxypeptidase [Artemisia annua]
MLRDEADFGLERLHLSAEKELQIDEEAATKDNFNDFREGVNPFDKSGSILFQELDEGVREWCLRALGVGDIEFVSCSPTVYTALLMDWTKNIEAGIPELHEHGIKLPVCPREYDVICNWLGYKKFLSSVFTCTTQPKKLVYIQYSEQLLDHIA